MKKAQLVSLENNQALTTSRIVADKFDKRHDHIVRDIRSIIEQAEDELGIKRMFVKFTH